MVLPLSLLPPSVLIWREVSLYPGHVVGGANMKGGSLVPGHVVGGANVEGGSLVPRPHGQRG